MIASEIFDQLYGFWQSAFRQSEWFPHNLIIWKKSWLENWILFMYFGTSCLCGEMSWISISIFILFKIDKLVDEMLDKIDIFEFKLFLTKLLFLLRSVTHFCYVLFFENSQRLFWTGSLLFLRLFERPWKNIFICPKKLIFYSCFCFLLQIFEVTLRRLNCCSSNKTVFLKINSRLHFWEKSLL